MSASDYLIQEVLWRHGPTHGCPFRPFGIRVVGESREREREAHATVTVEMPAHDLFAATKPRQKVCHLIPPIPALLVVASLEEGSRASD